MSFNFLILTSHLCVMNVCFFYNRMNNSNTNPTGAGNGNNAAPKHGKKEHRDFNAMMVKKLSFKFPYLKVYDETPTKSVLM